MRSRDVVIGTGLLLCCAQLHAQALSDGVADAPLRLTPNFVAPYVEMCGAPCDFTADLHGNTLVVSRYTIDVPAGVIALFTRAGSQWTATSVLQNPCPTPPDGSDPVPCWNPELGRALALSGRYLFASLEDADASEPRAVLVYRRDRDRWREHQRITLPNPHGWEMRYARIEQLAAHGDTLAVSVVFDGTLGGVEQQLETVYVLQQRRHRDRFRLDTQLQPDAATPYSNFGAALALADDTLVVGAPGEAGSAGAVYVYEEVGRKWRRIQKLTTDRTGEQRFGEALALNGHTLAVGAPRDLDAETWRAGFVYVYRSWRNRWFEQARLEDPVRIPDPSGFTLRFFGTQLALKHGVLAIGASAAFPDYQYEYPLGFVLERRRNTWTTIADFVPSPGLVRLELSRGSLMAVQLNLRFGDNTYIYALPPRTLTNGR
jgi:hypothetical protein